MSKKVEIFSGTGGVGKTTLAVSRSLHLADQGKKILLITIDPSKRLKQVLGISDESSGSVVDIGLDFKNGGSLSAMLMNPQLTIKRIGELSRVNDFESNRIVEILARPNGGLNEILSLVELQLQLDENKFDLIVLDTPPGSHFLDFLESSSKIEAFFDKKFIEVFKFISEKEALQSKGKFAIKLISTGVNKLIGYLEKVTGATFVADFVAAISVIYKTKDVFKRSLSLKNDLKNDQFASWFLVTSVDQSKIAEALNLFESAKNFFGKGTTALLNKTINQNIKDWSPSTQEDKDFKESLLYKERELKKTLSSLFDKVIEFDEIISNSPQEHVNQLKNQWI